MLDLSKKRVTGPAVRLHSADNVVVARTDIQTGASVEGYNIVARNLVPAGYKIAIRDIAEGEPVHGVLEILKANIRVPEASMGDFWAGIAANNVAENRVIGLFEKYTGAILGTAYEVAAPVSILLLVLIYRQIQMRRDRQVVR